jgi:hypothetical protein
MKVKYTEGILSLELVDVIHEMTEEEQLLLVESLACQSSIIEFVGQQITKGYTENGFHGGRYWGSPDASTALDKVIREIANKSGEIAEKEIKRLCDLVNFHEKQTKKEHEKLFNLEKQYNELLERQRQNY